MPRTLALAALCLLTALAPAAAQELRARVTVNAPQLTLIPPEVIGEFEENVRDFLNQTRFTDDEYEDFERIECNFTFSIGGGGEISETRFNAQLLVQSTRPVYGADYQTTLINYLDDPVLVEYEQYQPLEYNGDQFTSSLVALLSFYAHVVIGMDKDSFAPLAGEELYRRAEAIVSAIPAGVVAQDAGWTNESGRGTRYRLLLDLLNPRARPYRQMLYDYHRLGLDAMAADPVAGRAVLGESLTNLEDVHSDIPNTALITNFSAAKSQELLEVYAQAPQAERQAAYKVLSSVDPGNINRFRALR